MFINELIEKRAYCPVCGEKIPSIRRMNVSIFKKIIVCPHCFSQMTLKKSALIINLLLYFLIFPALILIVNKGHDLLGVLALFILICVSLLNTYIAKYKIVSAQ